MRQVRIYNHTRRNIKKKIRIYDNINKEIYINTHTVIVCTAGYHIFFIKI